VEKTFRSGQSLLMYFKESGYKDKNGTNEAPQCDDKNLEDYKIDSSTRDGDLDVDSFTSSIVPETDDPTMPQFTFRVLILGTFWCVIFAGIYVLF
jgi:hypothetical protein